MIAMMMMMMMMIMMMMMMYSHKASTAHFPTVTKQAIMICSPSPSPPANHGPT